MDPRNPAEAEPQLPPLIQQLPQSPLLLPQQLITCGTQKVNVSSPDFSSPSLECRSSYSSPGGGSIGGGDVIMFSCSCTQRLQIFPLLL